MLNGISMDWSFDEGRREGERKKNLHVLFSTLTVDNNVGRLTTIEPGRDLSMLTLTLVTASRGLTLAGSRTTTAADTLVVGRRIVGERGEDVRAALLELRDEEGQR
jgi:hypothetical protein